MLCYACVYLKLPVKSQFNSGHRHLLRCRDTVAKAKQGLADVEEKLKEHDDCRVELVKLAEQAKVALLEAEAEQKRVAAQNETLIATHASDKPSPLAKTNPQTTLSQTRRDCSAMLA